MVVAHSRSLSAELWGNYTHYIVSLSDTVKSRVNLRSLTSDFLVLSFSLFLFFCLTQI